MEAAEKTLTHRDDTGLPSNKLLKHVEQERHAEESNYVDLDMKAEDAPRTVRVTFTGEGSQLSVSQTDGSRRDPDSDSDPQTDMDSECSDGCGGGGGDDDGELHYTDMCLRDTELPESHYITTHEIQLTELDHDVDYELGRGTRWDFEDGNLVYAFVDYASFESNDTQEGTVVLSRAKERSYPGGAEREESDPCASSDESLCRTQSGGEPSAGKTHLSTKTSSRSVNDHGAQWCARQLGDGSLINFVNPGARAGPMCDRGPYFIPAPGRQHLATKLRRKDINEYSSGASSSISELDDADKEVRNLTAKSFRSLACPYFDAINLSTSSESSISEYGLNKWSAYVDWNYRNIAHSETSATLEMRKTVDKRRNSRCKSGISDQQTQICALKQKRISQQTASSDRELHMKDKSAEQGVTLNFHCNVESSAPLGPKCFQRNREMQNHHTDSSGDTHKRAFFASSLLKNVISKKMQFEQERKMERGEISDSHPSVSPSFSSRDLEAVKERCDSRGLQRETSELGNIVNTQDDLRSTSSSCSPADETKGDKKATDCPQEHQITPQEPPFEKEAEPASVRDSQTTQRTGLDTSSVLTKLLFVPNCQLLSKDESLTEEFNCNPSQTGAKKCEKEVQTVDEKKAESKEKHERVGKAPEIKICLRNVKESKDCSLNIANLLTPKINYNVNKFRAADNGRCRVLPSEDKVPSFSVRDIRDTKCKFQTPIYHVRDVRKLVKSSYHFVSYDRSDQRCSTVAEEKPKVELDKPSPMVIKCNFVKTNLKADTDNTARAQVEGDAPSETPNRVPAVVPKQGNTDQKELQSNHEAKLGKQRQDRFTGETNDRKNDPTMPKQEALEKLKAAVKTMEQLYVFDRNEWKRKTQDSHLVSDSHVLPLISKQNQGATDELEVKNSVRIPQCLTNCKETQKTQGDRRSLNIIHVPYNYDTFKTQSQQSNMFTNRSVLHFGNKKHVTNESQDFASEKPSAVKSTKTPMINPVSEKIVKDDKAKSNSTNLTNTRDYLDSENYLTIPGLGSTDKTEQLNQKPEGISSFLKATSIDVKVPEQNRSHLTLDCLSSTSYHLPTAATSPQKQQQILSFSPSLNMSPTPSRGEAVTQTQRKMLLDPTTGHYYLVDTPLLATTKRLFDPETGMYVDVPMPHSPVASVTPAPFSMSPLALTPTYMVYPGFISPTLAAQAIMSHTEDKSGENIKDNALSPGAEKAYYSATAEAQQGPLHLPLSLGHVSTKGGPASSDKKALISITKPYGPRIIAPPSFDGKTMSYVVEHR